METDSKEIKKLKKIFKQQKKIIKKLNTISEEVEHTTFANKEENRVNPNNYKSDLYKDVVLKIIDNFSKNEDTDLSIDSRIQNVYFLRIKEEEEETRSSGLTMLKMASEDVYVSMTVNFNENIIHVDFGDGEVAIRYDEDIQQYKDRFEEIYCKREKAKLNDLMNKILNDTKLSRIESLNNLL